MQKKKKINEEEQKLRNFPIDRRFNVEEREKRYISGQDSHWHVATVAMQIGSACFINNVPFMCESEIELPMCQTGPGLAMRLKTGNWKQLQPETQREGKLKVEPLQREDHIRSGGEAKLKSEEMQTTKHI